MNKICQNSFLKKYLIVLLFITFCLISLGGAVRAMNAGLACPDWPLCFNKVIPEYQMHVYYEFIHRAIAGFVAILTLILNIILFRGNYSKEVRKMVIVADFILLSQIVLGGLTVLKLLHFSVVTMHLVFGISFLMSLLWIYFLLFVTSAGIREPTPKSFHLVLLTVALILAVQIILGGLVSSNYAGLACEGFPLCNGEWIPTLDGFVGLQVKHRLWGYFTALSIFAFTNVIWKNRNKAWISPRIVRLGFSLSAMIVLQILVGVANVIYKLPPVITVLHLALATGIMAEMLKILYLGTRKA